MKKSKWIIVFFLAIFLGFGAAKYYWDFSLSAVDSQNPQKKVFVVSKGESVKDISARLEKEGLIRLAFIFGIEAKRLGMADKIQAGDFKLSQAMNLKEILQQLTTGVIDKWVTFPEGWRIEEMAARLNTQLNIPQEEFIQAAKEGYMFPDTYLFNVEAKASDVTSVMRNNFDKKYDGELQSKINKLGLTSEQGVILASIMEREARSDEARKMVASILLKRLKIGMGLNADATVQYALGFQQDEGSWWKRHLSREDLKIKSAYNTYLYRGLPPAPISNPGLSSLEAVANANSSTPYLYYYHDSQGVSHYGRTLEEHNQNISRYP